MGEKIAPLALEVDRAVLAVRELVASQGQLVRLALPSGLLGLFADDLAQLRQTHPQLVLETIIGSRPVDLKRGDADLAVRIGPVDDEDLIARPLGEVGWSLYASASYLENHPAPTDPQELTGHDLIGYGADLARLPAARWVEAHSAQATIVLRSNELMTMLSAASSGAGLAVLPCFLAEIDPALVRLTLQVLAKRGFSLVYRREARLAESVRLAVRFLIDVMRTRADRISGAVDIPSRFP